MGSNREKARLGFRAMLALVAGTLVWLPTRWNIEVAVMVGVLMGVCWILRWMRRLLGSASFAPHRPRLLGDDCEWVDQDAGLGGRPHWADCCFVVRRARMRPSGQLVGRPK